MLKVINMTILQAILESVATITIGFFVIMIAYNVVSILATLIDCIYDKNIAISILAACDVYFEAVLFASVTYLISKAYDVSIVPVLFANMFLYVFLSSNSLSTVFKNNQSTYMRIFWLVIRIVGFLIVPIIVFTRFMPGYKLIALILQLIQTIFNLGVFGNIIYVISLLLAALITILSVFTTIFYIVKAIHNIKK